MKKVWIAKPCAKAAAKSTKFPSAAGIYLGPYSVVRESHIRNKTYPILILNYPQWTKFRKLITLPQSHTFSLHKRLEKVQMHSKLGSILINQKFLPIVNKSNWNKVSVELSYLQLLSRHKISYKTFFFQNDGISLHQGF